MPRGEAIIFHSSQALITNKVQALTRNYLATYKTLELALQLTRFYTGRHEIQETIFQINIALKLLKIRVYCQDLFVGELFLRSC